MCDVSEILIEGHTDTDGDYLFNLELSQKRAYSVAEFCLDEDSDILTVREREALRELLMNVINSKQLFFPTSNIFRMILLTARAS